MTDNPLISRRRFLRSALVGGSGLAAAALVGCGGDDGDDASGDTQTPGAAGATSAAATATPAPTPAPPRWGRLPEAGAVPAPRRDHSLVSDGQRVYLFGGRGDGTLADLWTYDLNTRRWSELPATGPAARFGHNSGYDTATARMLVFGGQATGFFNDVWAYQPTAGSWQEVTAGSGPSPRYGAASALDGAGRLLISHGFTDSGRFDDTWAYGGPAGDAWGDLSPAAGRPIERCLTRGAWDAAGNQFLMFGGQTNSAPYLGDTWSLTETGWAEWAPTAAPSPRNLFSMVFDDERQRAILFGGRAESGLTNDVWAFNVMLGEWTPLTVEGEPPSPRSGHDAVWLAGRRTMLVFGGEDENGDLNDAWELAFQG